MDDTRPGVSYARRSRRADGYQRRLPLEGPCAHVWLRSGVRRLFWPAWNRRSRESGRDLKRVAASIADRFSRQSSRSMETKRDCCSARIGGFEVGSPGDAAGTVWADGLDSVYLEHQRKNRQ